jgi:hypothetical protein
LEPKLAFSTRTLCGHSSYSVRQSGQQTRLDARTEEQLLRLVVRPGGGRRVRLDCGRHAVPDRDEHPEEEGARSAGLASPLQHRGDQGVNFAAQLFL